jgi:hypothetical protein
MANANTNRFFPIFPDGEDSAPAPSGSNSRSKKPAAKRSRQETPSPPNAPAARAHTPAPLAIEAPPPHDDTAITSRLDEIELTMRKYLIRLDAVNRHLETTGWTPQNVDITIDRVDAIYNYALDNHREKKMRAARRAALAPRGPR